MPSMTRDVLAGLVLGLAVLPAAPAVRAEQDEGMGLQAVVERMREEAMRNGPGWRNGFATLTVSGTGYGIAYSGTPQGSAGRGPLTVVGNSEGNPIVDYADTALPRAGSLAQRRDR